MMKTSFSSLFSLISLSKIYKSSYLIVEVRISKEILNRFEV